MKSSLFSNNFAFKILKFLSLSALSRESMSKECRWAFSGVSLLQWMQRCFFILSLYGTVMMSLPPSARTLSASDNEAEKSIRCSSTSDIIKQLKEPFLKGIMSASPSDLIDCDELFFCEMSRENNLFFSLKKTFPPPQPISRTLPFILPDVFSIRRYLYLSMSAKKTDSLE
ncbi:MAG: hypothetical protein PHW02_06795 [bacterium]|nr:hypothetical protein [bacterium]